MPALAELSAADCGVLASNTGIMELDVFSTDVPTQRSGWRGGWPLPGTAGAGTGITIEIGPHQPQPPWILPLIQSLNGLLNLTAGWDSYQGARIDRDLVFKSLPLIFEILGPDARSPAVVPL
ncbi:MAG TPA: hypothetical protein VNL71_09040, partial [Chloroflexota bacterium]|nr:hypothetical protein [Chloroflexota bacterium]